MIRQLLAEEMKEYRRHLYAPMLDEGMVSIAECAAFIKALRPDARGGVFL
jgi:hypothetical protein